MSAKPEARAKPAAAERRKSRLRSNPFPLARVPATRPSGFWMTLKTTTDRSRTRSTSGSVP